MADMEQQVEGQLKKRKGTPLLAVMDESCSSCAGSPVCELHCPVEDCINLLYEETPNGGMKLYRVWVDNDKCIGCQMCFGDDLTSAVSASRFFGNCRWSLPWRRRSFWV